MAHDDDLAEHVRALLAPDGPIDEKRMFGGLAFMVGGHMAVALTGHGGLMVRVPADDLAGLLELEHVEPMEMGRRTSRTWLHVTAPGLGTDDAVAGWVERGVAAVRRLPARR